LRGQGLKVMAMFWIKSLCNGFAVSGFASLSGLLRRTALVGTQSVLSSDRLVFPKPF